MNNAFKTNYGVEMIANDVARMAPAMLIPALVRMALVFGIDRTEAAIKSTFTQADSETIIAAIVEDIVAAYAEAR